MAFLTFDRKTSWIITQMYTQASYPMEEPAAHASIFGSHVDNYSSGMSHIHERFYERKFVDSDFATIKLSFRNSWTSYCHWFENLV